MIHVLLLAASAAFGAEPAGNKAVSTYPFAFRDVGTEAGLLPHAAGIRGHGAAWGDADGDGWPDLFVGTFHNEGSQAGVFLRNERGKFRPGAEGRLCAVARDPETGVLSAAANPRGMQGYAVGR